MDKTIALYRLEAELKEAKLEAKTTEKMYQLLVSEIKEKLGHGAQLHSEPNSQESKSNEGDKKADDIVELAKEEEGIRRFKGSARARRSFRKNDGSGNKVTENVIRIRECDLLKEIDKQGVSVAHCVAMDMRMGAGIAKDLKKKCRINTKQLSKGAKVGDIVAMKYNDDYVIQLVTKEESQELPEWKDFERTIRGLPNVCLELGIKKLAMPMIGCGLDALRWSDASELINKIFQGTSIEITIAMYAEKNYGRTSIGSKKRISLQPSKPKVFVVGDSHTKGIGRILEQKGDNSKEYASWVQSGATTEMIADNINSISSHLGPKDNLVVMTGTNDIKWKSDGSCSIDLAREARRNIMSQARRTKVILLSVPLRYDKPDAINVTKIYNEQLLNAYKKEAENLDLFNIRYLEVNDFLTEEHYARDKVHLNDRGKEVLSQEIDNCVWDFNNESDLDF